MRRTWVFFSTGSLQTLWCSVTSQYVRLLRRISSGYNRPVWTEIVQTSLLDTASQVASRRQISGLVQTKRNIGRTYGPATSGVFNFQFWRCAIGGMVRGALFWTWPDAVKHSRFLLARTMMCVDTICSLGVLLSNCFPRNGELLKWYVVKRYWITQATHNMELTQPVQSTGCVTLKYVTLKCTSNCGDSYGDAFFVASVLRLIVVVAVDLLQVNLFIREVSCNTCSFSAVLPQPCVSSGSAAWLASLGKWKVAEKWEK